MINQQQNCLLKSLFLWLKSRCETAAVITTLRPMGFIISCLLIATHSAHAELSLRQDRLSVNVQEASLKAFLEVLTQQSGIRVTALDEHSFAEATISARFNQIPVPEALDRLLVQWNFGLTTDRGTGRIREVFLASKRIKPEDVPARPQPVAPSSYSEGSSGQSEFRENLVPFSTDSEFEGEHDSEDLEESHGGDFILEGGEITEDMIPEDLPPEIREALLQDIEATREGR